MHSIIFKTSVLSLVLVLVLVIGFEALTTAQQTGVPPVLYLTIFNSNLEAWSSFSTYNPNILGGGMGGSFYGLVWSYSAILNVSNNQMLPIIFTNWTISPANWEQVWQNESINITISMVHSGWSNGTPLTAWDVVATCYWLDMLGAPPYYNFYVINNYTFIMSVPKGLFSPYNLPFTLLNTVGLGEVAIIIPYSAWKPIIQQIVGNWSIIQTGNSTAMQIIKTIRAEERSYRPNPYTYAYNGPFYLASLSPSEIVLMKNPYYFMANEIPFQEVVVYQYGSSTGALSALISGKASLDWSGLLSIPPTYIPLLPSYEKLITIPQPFGWGLYFNFKNPWLRIQQVRQAIAYVLNRTSIAEAGGVLYSPVPIPNGIPNFTYYSQFITPNLMAKLNPYPTNLTKAARLLESVGFTQKNGIWYTPNGSELTLRILNTNNQPDLLNMLTAISNELTAFGIPTEVVTITTISVVHQMWQTGTGYDVFFGNWGGYYPGTVDWFLQLSYLSGYPWNVTQWNDNITLPNGTVIDLYQLFQQTYSPSSAQQLLQSNQEIAYYENQFLSVLPLVQTSQTVLVNTQLLPIYPNESWYYQEVLYGIAGTAFITSLLMYFYPHYKPIITSTTTTTTTSTTPTTTTSTTPTTTTVTTTSVVSSISTAVSTVVSTVSSVVTSTVSALPVSAITGFVVVIIILIALLVYFATRKK